MRCVVMDDETGDIDKDNVALVLRSLERKGLVESFIGADGQVRWRATDKRPPDDLGDVDGELDA
jgi:hypothetical protein